MSAGSGDTRGFEPWAWLAFALVAAHVVLFLALGSRPGAPLGPFLYTVGAITLGLSSVALLAIGLVWSVLRRPVLGRRRILPLSLLGLCIVVSSLPLPYPSSHEKRWSTVSFRLPFDGEWRVLWGGSRRAENALVLSPSRRFGFEFEPLPEPPFEPAPGEQLEGVVRGSPHLVAPADGRVVAVEEGPAGHSPFGNHLVLEVNEGEFLVLANLHRNMDVAPGEEVRKGQPIGALSMGGGPLGERLLVHLQDSPVPGEGEGIPMRFRDYEADGRRVEAGVPTGGLRGGLATGQIVRVPGPR